MILPKMYLHDLQILVGYIGCFGFQVNGQGIKVLGSVSLVRPPT